MSFQPTQIPGCILWLDAADSSTLNANPVTTWTDKSGAGNNALVTSPPTGTGGPTQGTYNSYPVISFNGTNQTLRCASCTITFNNHTLIAVHRPATITGNLQGNTSLFRFQNVGGQQYVVFPYMNNTTPRGYITNATGATNLSFTNSTLVENSVTTSLNLIIANIAPTVQTTFKNGTQQAINSQSISGTNPFPLQIGCIPNITGSPADFYQGDLGEMIIYNRSITTQERQQVEGYLAWKWGLQASLPTTHPYYNFPPTSLTIQSSTELNLVNTLVQNGRITLPPAATIPGRILTFKDIYGSFGVSTAILSTSGVDRFEDNTNLDVLHEPFGSYSFVAGLDSKWYTIGGSQMNTANISSIFTLNLNTNFISSGNITASTLRIIDSFSQSTTTVYNQSTLMYFSSPTGLSIVGPTKAPRSSFILTRGTFNPRSLVASQSNVIWLDASDPNTYVINNGFVSRWNNKSSGASTNFFTPATADTITVTSQNGLSVINLASNRMNAAAGVINWRSRFTMIFVAETNNGNFLVSNGAAAYGRYVFPANNSLMRINQTGIFIVADSQFTGGGGGSTIFPNGQFNIFILGFANTQVGSPYRVNGTVRTTTTDADSITDGIVNEIFVLNGNNFGTTSGPTQLAEMFLYNTNLSTTQCEQVEGYLAWKWGLVGNLPVNHPFKNSPP